MKKLKYRLQFISLFCILNSLFSADLYAEESAKPLSCNGYLKADDISNFHGGTRRGSVVAAAGLFNTVLDTEAANLWKGGQWTLGVLGIKSTNDQNLYTNAIQAPSGLAARSAIRIGNLNLQQKIGEFITARAGIFDLNDFFNVTEEAGQLINSGFGNSPTLAVNSPLATYPFPGWGAMLVLGDEPTSFQIGAFQGDPEHQKRAFSRGNMLIAEITQHIEGNKQIPEFILKGGAWRYKQSDSEIGEPSHGFYVISEVVFEDNPNQHKGFFLQFGINPKKSDLVRHYIGTGLNLSGINPIRKDDSLNIGVSKAWLSGDLTRETVFEIAYAIHLADKLFLTPDLQYIITPGGVNPNATVGIVRLNYQF